MKKIIKALFCLSLLAAVIYFTDVGQDKAALQENLIRLHIVANSDSEEDQAVKLQVRDAVVSYLQPLVSAFSDKKQALAYVSENLAAIQQVADHTLAELGVDAGAVVRFGKEAYDTREYDTFSLPAGVYDSLRIEIGEGQGKNWWCVVFPSLCLPATSEGFRDTAVASGFSENLGETLSSKQNFRFFILDCFGKIENIFH